MKNLYLSFATCLVLGASALTPLQAQLVNKTPVLEYFSSSTCPPCKPASDYLTPILDANKDDIVVIKNQMNWPGAGDPYYIEESVGRRSYYGVNSVPATAVNGEVISYQSITSSTIETWNTELSPVDFKLKYYVDAAAKTVTIRGEARIRADIDDALRFYVAINENITFNNIKTNGEVEFHNVFKKFVPDQNGIPYFQGLSEGDTVLIDETYTFQGNYRLPQDAGDPIDHSIEHSVEDFDNLHVVSWAQALITKEHFQAVNGEKVNSPNDLTITFPPPLSVEEFTAVSDMKVYPNPMADESFAAFNLNQQGQVSLEVTNLLGKVVNFSNHGQLPAGQHQLTIDASNLAVGTYFVTLRVNDQVAEMKKVAITR